MKSILGHLRKKTHPIYTPIEISKAVKPDSICPTRTVCSLIDNIKAAICNKLSSSVDRRMEEIIIIGDSHNNSRMAGVVESPLCDKLSVIF